MIYKDLNGIDIRVGDFIAYAALWSRSPILKYGLVSRLASRKESFVYGREPGDVPTLRVITVDRDWKNNWELQNKGKDITLAFLDRLLVVPRAMVPKNVFDMLTLESLKREQNEKK